MKEFLKLHTENRNKTFVLENMNGNKEDCRIVYFPINESYSKGKLIQYNQPRALIEVGKHDFREVPYFYLTLKPEENEKT